MAIDTAKKRASLVGYGLPFRLMLPSPDGAIDAGDRQHLVGLYNGFTASVLVVSYPNAATLDGTGLSSATFSGTGLRSSTLAGSGLSGATFGPRTS